MFEIRPAFLFCKCLCILCFASFLLGQDRTESNDRAALRRELAKAAEPFEKLGEVFRLSVELAGPAIVHIETSQVKSVHPTKAAGRDVRMQVEETGSGVIAKIGGKTVILTNRHVVDELPIDSVRIRTQNRRQLTPKRIRTNEDFDLALIELAITGQEDGDDLPTIDLGDSDKVRIGDPILVVGSPFGLERSVSMGIVGAVARRRIPSAPAHTSLAGFIQIDAAVNPGSSGGPMLNLRGEVVGLVTAIATQSGTNDGIAFVTPINAVLRIARQLVESEVALRPYIGVGFDPAFDLVAHRRLGLDRLIGARVSRVLPDSPADRAGLQKDDIVLKLDATEIEDDAHLIQRVAQCEIDRPVSLTIFRNDKIQTLSITPSSQISR